MRLLGYGAAVAIAMAAIGAGATVHAPAPSSPMINSPSANSVLSVMTYNIEGLPWPVRLGRSGDLQQIGNRLRLLRRDNLQPHIVLLQEAFSADAQSIATIAGYPYIARGPSADDPATASPASNDLYALADRKLWKGEGIGKFVGSGLEILSDYPIRSVERAAFPEFACAGYDCLANKGMMMAVIDVPGQPEPLAIINTHLNSRAASGVSPARSLHAFKAQIGALAAFIDHERPAESPLILGGDFNIGHDLGRIAYFKERLEGVVGNNDNAFTNCLISGATCTHSMSADVWRSYRHGRDWEFPVSNATSRLTVRSISALFGHESDGTMLSDHIGYVVSYSYRNAVPSITSDVLTNTPRRRIGCSVKLLASESPASQHECHS